MSDMIYMIKNNVQNIASSESLSTSNDFIMKYTKRIQRSHNNRVLEDNLSILFNQSENFFYIINIIKSRIKIII